MNLLIRNAEILTMEDGEKTLMADLGISGDTIAFIGEAPEGFVADETIDADGDLVMPGFVNAHTHIPMSLFRSYADDLDFFTWLTERIFPAEGRLRGNDVYVGSMLTIAEMITFGVTTFADMYFFMDDIVRAVKESGIRANLSRGIVTIGESEEEAMAKIEDAFDFLRKTDGEADGRIRVDIAPHAPYTNPPEMISRIAEMAKKENARIHIHLSESKKEVEDSISQYGKSPVRQMCDLGLFDVKAMAAHCVHLSDDDMAILREKGVTVVHNPASNLKLGNGAARIYELSEMGVNIALGTDGSASNNNQNLLEEVKLAAILAKGTSAVTTAIPAFEALRMATVNGAKALGREDEIGSLKVGKKADVIIMSTKGPHWYPKLNTISNLVYSGQALDVHTTIVGGKVLMKDRKLTTIDIEKIKADASESARYLTSGGNE
jgi:5-methylthioadenosine/S-adenosylhomocysteine deaminase